MDNQETSNKINTPIQNMVESATKDSTVGPLIGSIIVILLILIGGLYFLSSLISTKKTEIQVEQAQEEQADTLKVEEAAKQSNSDDVQSIEADLKATNIDSLDKGLTEIDKEF
jgi:hypothetical protein